MQLSLWSKIRKRSERSWFEKHCLTTDCIPALGSAIIAITCNHYYLHVLGLFKEDCCPNGLSTSPLKRCYGNAAARPAANVELFKHSRRTKMPATLQMTDWMTISKSFLPKR
ncbi:hypothetical protein K402DRAFT_125927 [Aulographum hederae CBS 113979]|uniref:Uncharacterized protein n=1 Tax=Aulographum hederae CBS 113979 TaxID=1176131 RepID=A0A6G1HEV4_9PEZI|nr:hypothetical protein K402DRAFT_125927 [Aulographum hederae CBS 113979]